jgi:D-alanine-D-alanine ligase
MNIGVTFDTREDYNFSSSDWTHADFSTLSGITFLKKNLERCGHNVTLLGNHQKILHLYKESDVFKNIDIVFNTAEGLKSRNREGWIPSFLEMCEIPYIGSDASTLNLSLNKAQMKIISKYLRVPTPDFYEINSKEDIKIAFKIIGCPCVLKPNYEGSSSGLVLVTSAEMFEDNACSLLLKYNQTILCEKYIDGKEVTVPLLGTGNETKALGIVETVRNNGEPIGIYAIEEKFTDICSKIIPNLHKSVEKNIIEYAIRLHNYTGCCDFNRIDFRLDKNNNIYFLEANPLPDLSEESSYPMCCSLQNIPFHTIMADIINSAMVRYPNINS